MPSAAGGQTRSGCPPKSGSPGETEVKEVREKDVRLLMEISPERECLVHLMRGVELQRTKTIKAGKLLWCKSYPVWDTVAKKTAEGILQTKRDNKGTREAQKSLNARNAADKLVQLVNNNFHPGDIIITCTYASDRQPADLTAANRNMRNFVARLRRYCERKASPAPSYIYVTEILDKKRGTEYHHHMILKADITRDEAEMLWERGGHGHANTKIAKKLPDGLIRIARYMAKQVCSAASSDAYAARHRWCASKGLKVAGATEADRKISRGRVARIAEEMREDPVVARAHLQRCYPGYEVLEIDVRTSCWVSGAYVSAVLVRRE